MVRINSINYHGSISNGPGIRIVIFFQGCLRKCEGCHNPSTWDLELGIEKNEEELVKELKSNSPIRRVTISGGEPLLQSEGLVLFLKSLYNEGYDIALYTGFEYEEVPKEILLYLNYIKTGPYIKELTTSTRYYGSTNQQFIELR